MKHFKELAILNVNQHVQQKGQLNYLAWSYAVEQLTIHCPESSWEIKRFPVPDNPEILLPYLKTDLGYFVEVSVTVNGHVRTAMLPVLDHRNKTLMEPSAFDINTSHQRCLTKAAALYGIGLYLYHGLLEPSIAEDFTQEQWEAFQAAVEGTVPILFSALEQSDKDAFSAMLEVHLEPHREAKTVTKEKKRILELVQQGHAQADDYANQIVDFVEADDVDGLRQLREELIDAEVFLVWNRLDQSIKQKAKAMLSEAAA